MTWNTTRTFTPGEVFTASWCNQYLRDNLDDLDGRVADLETAAALTQVTSLSIPVSLAGITMAMDIVTGLVPGVDGEIVNVQFVVTEVVTTGGAAVDLNVEIGTTNLTGGVVELTSANCATLGAVIAGSAITANNTLESTDAISVEASDVSAFSEGAGVLIVTIEQT